VRIVGYSPIGRALVVAPGPELLDISTEVALTLGKRGCAGRWEGDRYLPCGSEVAPYCGRCGAAAVDACVMCRGECRKPEKTCLEEHSVYLAAFAPDLIKVGVSRAWRLEARLREQGADAGFEVALLPDGEAARKMERSLSARFPDRATFEDKILPGPVADRAVKEVRDSFGVIREMRFSHFSREPWMKPIVIRPGEGTAISGRVFGIKGQALVLEKLDTLYAVNLDGLVGYDCELKKGPASLQSSLCSYGRD
jgi:hypothetical protein